MAAGTYALTLPGPMLQRGFWLYVWRVVAPDGKVAPAQKRKGRTDCSIRPQNFPVSRGCASKRSDRFLKLTNS